MRALARYLDDLPLEKRRLSLVAGYFRLTAGLYVFGTAAAAVLMLTGRLGTRISALNGIASVALGAAYTAGFWYTANLLDDRRRDGAWLALFLFAAPLVAAATHIRSAGFLDVLIPALGIYVLARAWKYLT